MITEFKLPELGENIESADITKILISAGDVIKVDQIVMEIETDKATVEVPADKAGKVIEILVKEGESAAIGKTIYKLEPDNSNKFKSDSGIITAEKNITEKERPKKAEKKSLESAAPVKEKDYEVRLPVLGENIETADITKVLISKGDKINIDQIILEIETDKATVEIPSEVNGIVKTVNVKAGETAKVGQVICIVKITDVLDKPVKKPESTPKAEVVHSPIEKPVETLSNTKPANLQRISFDKIVPAAPSVRRFAREIGVDIHNMRGSGPGGRISIDDVKHYAKSLNEKISKPGAFPGIAAQPLPDFSKWGSIEKKPMSNVRRKTAEHLSYAWSTIPHVTQFDKADITQLEKLRKQFAPKAEAAGGKLTVTAILLKIIASALKVFPQFNTSLDIEKQEIIYKSYYNIGIAVDTEKGLLVPVIRDVDKKNIIQLSAELSEISKKAREKKISLEEMRGGNFSISNLGGIGGTYFSPIVNSPEVAILGVSRGMFEAVYINGEFVPRLMLPLSLSYDHRIIDGADGARFIGWVVNALENPFLLSLEG